MRTLPELLMLHINQVKVVHHLPGRLRLYVPLLEKLSPEWGRYQSDLIEIIKLKEGLVDIELSTISGRVLICYDPHRTGKARILQWIKKVALTLYGGYVDAPFQSKREIAPFLRKMHSKCRHWVQNTGHIGKVA